MNTEHANQEAIDLRISFHVVVISLHSQWFV